MEKSRLQTWLDTAVSGIRFAPDRKKVEETVTSPDTYGSPWYGQLMALPQLWAYYLQINRWLAVYAPEICWG